MSDQAVAETSTGQRTRLARDRYLCLPGGYEPAVPVNEQLITHPRLRPSGHRDRMMMMIIIIIIIIIWW
jgi:hypothetical protein